VNDWYPAPVTAPAQPDLDAVGDRAGDAVDASWATIDGERQRVVEPGQSTQFKLTITAPPGTPVANYWFQGRVYSADVAPEESSTLSNRVTFPVAQPSGTPTKPFPWWIVILAVAVAAVLGVGAYLLTRPDAEKQPPAATSTTSAVPTTSATPPIPPIEGKSEAEARAELTNAGLYPDGPR
jgi:hypothetical protein